MQIYSGDDAHHTSNFDFTLYIYIIENKPQK